MGYIRLFVLAFLISVPAIASDVRMIGRYCHVEMHDVTAGCSDSPATLPLSGHVRKKTAFVIDRHEDVRKLALFMAGKGYALTHCTVDTRNANFDTVYDRCHFRRVHESRIENYVICYAEQNSAVVSLSCLGRESAYSYNLPFDPAPAHPHYRVVNTLDKLGFGWVFCAESAGDRCFFHKLP